MHAHVRVPLGLSAHTLVLPLIWKAGKMFCLEGKRQILQIFWAIPVYCFYMSKLSILEKYTTLINLFYHKILGLLECGFHLIHLSSPMASLWGCSHSIFLWFLFCVGLTYLSNCSCFMVVMKLGIILLVCFEDQFLSTLDVIWLTSWSDLLCVHSHPMHRNSTYGSSLPVGPWHSEGHSNWWERTLWPKQQCCRL